MDPTAPRRPAEIDAAESRWLAWHEARSHGLIGREVRALGDAVLLHDRSDREPFWNRMAGIAWPDDAAAFDRRLAEAIALFASIDRTPHVWPLPGFDEPADLTNRLMSHGFADMGAGLMMALDPALLADRPIDGAGRDTGVTLERIHKVTGDRAYEVVQAIVSVLGDAFAVEPFRTRPIEEETLVLLERDEFHGYLARVDGVPAAVARRTTFAGASYLSSIGTHSSFRGRGLGRLVTDAAMRDALEAGSRWTYLGVFSDNDVARRMYEGLGFVAIGGPAPDLLLRA
jgi:ribosomal protein S18 acetylase RimI-like enzyme